MSFSRPLLNRLFLTGVALGTVAAYATLSRPSAHAQMQNTICEGYPNPCTTTPCQNNLTCSPGASGYIWGNCNSASGKSCTTALSQCVQWNCNTTPTKTGNNCSNFSFNSCQ
jgi:hypothetical protein